MFEMFEKKALKSMSAKQSQHLQITLQKKIFKT